SASLAEIILVFFARGKIFSVFCAEIIAVNLRTGVLPILRSSQNRLASKRMRKSKAMNINPITVEVVRNAVNAYADEMATALCKSAYNMMIYEVRDFCCGLIDAQGRMISQNRGGLPIFLADLGIAVEDGIERYGLAGFAPGDVVIMNHGLVCGRHFK